MKDDPILSQVSEVRLFATIINQVRQLHFQPKKKRVKQLQSHGVVNQILYEANKFPQLQDYSDAMQQLEKD